MKIASFDIGIKNMAYCVFEYNADISGSRYPNIIDWNVLNLGDTEVLHCCNQTLKKSSQICNKKAKFMKTTSTGSQYFCVTHAKNSEYIIPNKIHTSLYVKKLKKDELINYMNANCISMPELGDSKKLLLEQVLFFFQTRVLDKIKKPKNANIVDLVTIGKNIKRDFNVLNSMNGLDQVIIENQISPIASRMKTIQGLLTQYFIMKYDENLCITYVSSSNKLKGLEKQNTGIASEYKQHKKDAIAHTKDFLENPIYMSWKHILSHSKKDDLADCFLQGIQFIRNSFGKTK